MGDVAGVGPEIIARAWPELLPICRPVVVGDPHWLRRALALVGDRALVREIAHPREADPGASQVPCLATTEQHLTDLQSGQVSAAAGRAAYDFLCAAIDWTMERAADGIVTAPLH